MKKLKKEYLALIGIIVVLLLYLIISGGKNKMSYEIPNIANIDAGEINRIEVTQGDNTLVLTGKEDTWKILPQEYPADSVKVKDMLDSIEKLTLTELAAENKDFQRYELNDEKKISVTAFKNDVQLRKFDIGKTSSTYRHTFVRIQDDTNIYYARNSIRSHFEQELKELRDKIVLAFEKAEISTAVFTTHNLQFSKQMLPKETSEAEKTAEDAAVEPQPEETWVLTDGTKANQANLDTVISAMADLRCDEYIEGTKKEELHDPIFIVTLKGNKDYTVSIFKKEDKEDGKYPAISSGNQYPFMLSTYTAERIMKKQEELTESEENS